VIALAVPGGGFLQVWQAQSYARRNYPVWARLKKTVSG
jgi:hypothetical protein